MSLPPLWHFAATSFSLYASLCLFNTTVHSLLLIFSCLQCDLEGVSKQKTTLLDSLILEYFFSFLTRYIQNILISIYPDPELNINMFVRNVILIKFFHLHLILCSFDQSSKLITVSCIS